VKALLKLIQKQPLTTGGLLKALQSDFPTVTIESVAAMLRTLSQQNLAERNNDDSCWYPTDGKPKGVRA
jgi:hypothetical protein